MKDNPQAQGVWQAKIAKLTERIATPLRFGEEIADAANRRPSKMLPLDENGKFKPEGTFER